MYLAHWNLKRRPFRNVPDTRFFFHSATHDAALAELLYTIDESLGAALLVGPFGSGKSLVLRALLNGLSQVGHYRTGLLTNALMSGAEVVLGAARALGASDLPERAADVSESYAQDRLEQRLVALSSTGVRAVLAIDDAQVIASPGTWQALRLMLGIQLGERAPLTLILAGSEELLRRIEGAPGFAERVGVRTALAPLPEEDALDYLLHRLACAGAGRGIFTRQAAQNIVRLAGGLPARINQLADLALAAAFGLGLAVVGPEVVDMVASEMSR
jgi:type II secretory pathway predicted ATPase ExeA